MKRLKEKRKMSNNVRDNFRKERTGTVVSDKMEKTIVVQVRHKTRHPKFGKVMEKANKYKAHDEKNEAKTGDVVRIQETRPLSKDKHWRLVEILQQDSKKNAAQLKEGV